jgi:hypothetical protein
MEDCRINDNVPTHGPLKNEELSRSIAKISREEGGGPLNPRTRKPLRALTNRREVDERIKTRKFPATTDHNPQFCEKPNQANAREQKRAMDWTR